MTSNELKYLFLLQFDALYEYSAPNYNDDQISKLLTMAQNRVFLDIYCNSDGSPKGGFELSEKARKDIDQLIKSATISCSGISGQIIYSGTTVTGSAIITQLSSIVGLVEGITISGSGIPSNATIKTILGPTSIEISANCTISASNVSITSGLGKSIAQGGVHPNGVILDLPDNFLYSIEESAKLTGITDEAVVKPYKHDNYIANYKNPYKKPCSWLVWRMDVSRVTDQIGSTSASRRRTELISDGTVISSYRLRYLRYPPEIVVDEYTPSNQKHCILDAIGVQEAIVAEAVKIASAPTKPNEYQIAVAEAASSRK